MKTLKTPDDELADRIIGCAYRVHNTLGSGFLEKVYENALKIEMEKVGLNVRAQTPINVTYEGRIVGEFFADLLVEDRFILELKAVQHLLPEHEVQLVNYLTATGLDTGLLLNFGKNVEVRRKFRQYRKPTV